jgi:hypothetical protein
MTSGKEEFLREAEALRKKVKRLLRLVQRLEQTLDRLEAIIRADEEPKPYDVIVDSQGQRIKVGSRVLDAIGLPEATVTSIIPLDGDADDEGRPVAVGPYIYVEYDDGTEEKFTAHWSARGPEDMDAPFVCHDLTIAQVFDEDD